MSESSLNRAVRRAWAAYLSESARASRLAADYSVRPSDARFRRAESARMSRERALDRYRAAIARRDSARPVPVVLPAVARVAPPIGRVARQWAPIVGAALGLVAGVVPAIAFLSGVVPVAAIAAGLAP
jgi:hypothetical protein